MSATEYPDMPQQPWMNFRYIKEHASFLDVLDHYKLKAQGRGVERRLLCPFHNDTKPSCNIDLEKNAFHCFGCEAKGNILEFVQLMEDSDLRSAALTLAEICSIELAPPNEQRRQKSDQPAATKKRSKPAPKAKEPPPKDEPDTENHPLMFSLKLDPKHPYLDGRGVPTASREAFGVGYCSRGLMRNRICFPIRDEMGMLVAYAGRWAEDPVPEETAKYLLPKQFNKSRVLYNLDQLEGQQHVVVVESYWSVLRLHALGVPVVSPMGRSISKHQVVLLQEHGARFITIMFDGDEPGRRATEATLPLLAPSFFVHAVEMPVGTKPHNVDDATLASLLWHPNTRS